MIAANDLIRLFRQALAEKWGYIYGTSGETWTQAKQDKATRKQTVQYGQKWVGRKVADCSGLFVWAFKQLGEYIYHGSNTIWRSHLSNKGDLLPNGQRSDGKPLLPGTAVFQMSLDPKQDDGENQSHMGLYIGDNQVIEEYGTARGILLTDLISRGWEQWGELKKVYYTGKIDTAPVRPTLRKGDKGEAVRELQEALVARGYNLPSSGIDGDFGAETRGAVIAFQQDAGLAVDGIAGPDTWAALDVAQIAPEETPEGDNHDGWETMTQNEKLDDLNERLKKLEGR